MTSQRKKRKMWSYPPAVWENTPCPAPTFPSSRHQMGKIAKCRSSTNSRANWSHFLALKYSSPWMAAAGQCKCSCGGKCSGGFGAKALLRKQNEQESQMRFTHAHTCVHSYSPMRTAHLWLGNCTTRTFDMWSKEFPQVRVFLNVPTSRKV